MTIDASYIDYETFLDPSFSATSFANTLVLATNDPSDTPLDLSTPLSRVLFDVQEVDTHIDTLTTKSALPLLEYTQDRANASTHILEEVEAQVASLTEGYKRLEKDVIERYEAAEQVHLAAERLCQTVKLGRSVARCLQYARQLEVQMEELGPSTNVQLKKDGYRTMVPAAHTLLSMRQLFNSTSPGGEGEGLDRINVIATVRNDLIASADRALLGRAQQTIREFSMSSLLASNPSLSAPNSSATQSSAPTFAQAEDTKSRTTSALNTLYLLSPLKAKDTTSTFEPTLLIFALQLYLQTAFTSSSASLARALATFPTLDRTLLEISARCQNVVALEALLSSTRSPSHPLLSTSATDQANDDDGKDETRTLLQPLLAHLDTSSLPSYFWRTLASGLGPRVAEIMNKGGVSARTLRTNKDRVAAAVRECVAKGSRVPGVELVGKASAGGQVGNWEREAAVMVGSIIGPLGRY